MAAVESEADDKFASVDVENILSRVGRRPLTFNKTRFLYKVPEFLKRLTGEQTVNEGTTVQLETEVSGFPRPVLRWFKDEEEIVDHPRIHVESNGDGVFVFTIENVNKGDEAAYRCRAENEEGVSSSMFYLHVKVKPKSPKRSSKHLTKRTVSYPPMFPTIVEKVEEEEKAAKEVARSPPSPLTQLYDGLTLQTRHTWPKFLGDWAYVENVHRNGGSIGSETDSETGDGHSLESIGHDEVFSEESCEKSTEGEAASFYVSSDETTPETPDSLNEDITEQEIIASENVNQTTNLNNTSSKDASTTSDVDTINTTSDVDTINTSSDVDSISTKSDIDNISTTSGGVNKTSDVSVNTRSVDNVSSDSDVVNGNSSNVSKISLDANPEGTSVKIEPNNNEPKVLRGKRDMHLPLSNGHMSNDKIHEKGEQKESVLLDKSSRKKKDPGVKKTEDKKKSGEKVKVSKKTEDREKGEKSAKKTEKEKVVKKADSKEKMAKHESTGVKKIDSKDDTKLKPKLRDSTKSPAERKTLKKTDSKDRKTDSPKQKSESKEKKVKSDYISNPDPPILGSARPLVFTNLASKLATYTCTDGEKDSKSLDNAEVYSKPSVQSDVHTPYKDLNGDVIRCHDNMDLAIVPPPLGDVPFGRFFEEFIFVVCLFTFLALCIGIPSETFVLVILGMHFVYSMVTILGLC